MKYLDLTREILNDSRPYPGDPPVILTPEAVIERDGFQVRNLSFSSHQGTHIDAPAHVMPGGMVLNDFPLEIFSGPARVLKLGQMGPRTAITREMLEAFDSEFQGCERMLFSAQWDGDFFEDAPFFTTAAARWLVGHAELLMLGFDWPSPDEYGDEDLTIHRIFLSKGLIFVENLTNLEKLPARFTLAAFPLSLKDAEGAPVRAVAAWN